MEAPVLFADLETRSRLDLKAVGARRYASDLSTQITSAVWSYEGVLKTACPVHPHIGTHPISELYANLHTCNRFVAHHAAFDASILQGPNQNPFLQIPVSKVSCTMARAQSLSLPGGLDQLCATLNLQGKSPRGRALVNATCKPKRDGKFDENIDTFRELLAYNVQDVRCLMQVHQLLPELGSEERKIFERSWRKNDIGLPIDIQLATAIALRRSQIEAEVADQLYDITNGAVTAITQRQRILQWANSGNRAAALPGTKKHEVAEALDDPELHPDVREVLELVQESGGSAPMKAQSILNRHINGWYKDATRYFGARSGRGTSEGTNMFNIARPSGKYDVEDVIAGLRIGLKYDNTALTDALRGCIVAPLGYAIIDNDLSNAELRLAFWQAGDRERLDILASGGDLYMHNAITMWGLPDNATKDSHPIQRQNGKNTTLGGNYQLGWKTYKANVRKVGIKVSEEKAKDDIANYRKANPLLVRLWNDLKTAWANCFYEPPGRVFHVGKIALCRDGTTIWMRLPSGRCIPHYSVFVSPEGNMGFFRAKFGAMLPQKVFGGSLLEISCQSITRDIITACEDDIEKEMPDTILLLDVYDSVIALAPVEVAKQREEQMRSIMRRPRPWADGLLLDATGYSGPRMRK
jgi:DNA polymerase